MAAELASDRSVEDVVLLVLYLFSTAANALALLVFCRRPGLRTVSNRIAPRITRVNGSYRRKPYRLGGVVEGVGDDTRPGGGRAPSTASRPANERGLELPERIPSACSGSDEPLRNGSDTIVAHFRRNDLYVDLPEFFETVVSTRKPLWRSRSCCVLTVR